MKFLPKLLLLMLLAFPATILIKGTSLIWLLTVARKKRRCFNWPISFNMLVLATQLTSCCERRGRPFSIWHVLAESNCGYKHANSLFQDISGVLASGFSFSEYLNLNICDPQLASCLQFIRLLRLTCPYCLPISC